MKRNRLVLLLIFLLAALLGSYWMQHRWNTSWMSLAELNAYMRTFEAAHPGEPNYWDKGHWITAVDARWHGGAPQYRLRHGETPRNQGYWWYWYINQDQNSFSQKMRQYADEGFELTYSSACTWPDGAVHYQGVWHKYGKKKV